MDNTTTTSNLEPTRAEMEILHVLWANGPSAVRFVNDQLNKTKNTTYTATLKLMQLMHEKGILGRTEEGVKHIYFPLIQETETKKHLLDRFVNLIYKGSVSDMVIQLLGNHQPGEEELSEIKKLVQDMENNGNGTAKA